MAIKRYKPTTPGRRGMTVIDYREALTTDTPTKSLLRSKKKVTGRNNTGSITVRHKGGGVRKHYRLIDFKRQKDGIKGIVATVEYDPNRSSFISLINYVDGEKRYIIQPEGLKVGMTILSGKGSPIEIGNSLELQDMPEGTTIHNIELIPGKGSQIVRSAGTSAQILGADDSGRYILVRLNSGEVRKLLKSCRATIGSIGNSDWGLVNWGKAGRNRYRNIRPTVRGSVMNPNDHPHGGGEGKSPIGRPAPLTPWGKKALGVKTRRRKPSDKLIVRGRKQK